MKRICFFILTGLVLCSASLSAQSLRQVIRKTVVEPTRVANDVATDIAEEKAEEAITNAIMEGMGIEEDAKFEPEYTFTAWFQMEITDYKKNGKVDEQVVYDNYVNGRTLDYGLEYMDDNARATILFDSSAYAMIILSEEDGEKAGFATRMSPGMIEDAVEDAAEDEDYNPYKTGKTKKIHGYTCDEYLVEQEDSEVHMWASEKLGREISREILQNPNAFGSMFYHTRLVDGMILEYEVVDTDSGEKTVMLITDLDLNKKHSISTQGYTIMSMNLGE